jgi:hypothetical protein
LKKRKCGTVRCRCPDGSGQHSRRLDPAIKVGDAETGGVYALRAADTMPPGRSVPPHIHHREDEA